MRKKGDKPDADALVAQLAARQHGVISVAQLHYLEVSPAGIHRRVRANRLHPLHRGVYAVGHIRLSDHGRWMAAVFACGDGAVLSHTSAAALWGIRRRTGAVHVTVPSTAGKRKRAGIVLHRSSTLIARHCTTHDGIPVTTPARTLSDLKPILTQAQFAAALREAEFLRLPLDAGLDSDRARTDLEQLMVALCRRHRLPQPEVNVTVDRCEVDFLWRQQQLVVEVDGWGAHRTRSAFEEDRARDARLAVLGYGVVRFTWRRITDDPAAVAKTIRTLLEVRAA